MTRQPAQMPSGKLFDPPGAPGDPVIQLKVRLLGISPMIWRRVLVAASTTLRELHGVLQVAMGWQGLHLFQFCLRVARYGSQELSAHSPDVSLAVSRLRTGSRFLYEYDLNESLRSCAPLVVGRKRRMRNAFHRARIASEAHTPQLLMLSRMQDRRAAMPQPLCD